MQVEKPFCSETKPEALNASLLTPAADFFVRNHAPGVKLFYVQMVMIFWIMRSPYVRLRSA